jgi:hypothetical protein
MQNSSGDIIIIIIMGARGGAVEALRCRLEGRALDSQTCHWNFSLT